MPDTDCLQVAGMPEIVPHEKELREFFEFFSVPEKLNQLEQPATDELEVFMYFVPLQSFSHPVQQAATQLHCGN